MRVRLLPIILFFAFTSVVVKVFDAAVEKANSPDESVMYKFQALAQDAPAEAPVADSAGESGGDSGAPDDAKSSDEEAYLSPGYSGAGPKEIDVTNMTDMQKNLLESLAKRRKELESWSSSIAMKENILNATEKKINRKMDELNKLKDEVGKLLDSYNEKENRKVLRLVKIYEGMKPQSAAEIFEKMDMDILLDVIGKMKEAAAAKILAKMSSTKAKTITEKLAEQRRIEVN